MSGHRKGKFTKWDSDWQTNVKKSETCLHHNIQEPPLSLSEEDVVDGWTHEVCNTRCCEAVLVAFMQSV